MSVNLKKIADAMFDDKNKWDNITDEEKENSFFIFNRFFSKKYPYKSQLFNIKTIDKTTSMNLWHQFMKEKNYPQWFWSKSKEKKQNISNKDFKLLMKKLDINKEKDLEYLIENNYDIINNELKHFKKIENLKK